MLRICDKQRLAHNDGVGLKSIYKNNRSELIEAVRAGTPKGFTP